MSDHGRKSRRSWALDWADPDWLLRSRLLRRECAPVDEAEPESDPFSEPEPASAPGSESESESENVTESVCAATVLRLISLRSRGCGPGCDRDRGFVVAVAAELVSELDWTVRPLVRDRSCGRDDGADGDGRPDRVAAADADVDDGDWADDEDVCFDTPAGFLTVTIVRLTVVLDGLWRNIRNGGEAWMTMVVVSVVSAGRKCELDDGRSIMAISTFLSVPLSLSLLEPVLAIGDGS